MKNHLLLGLAVCLLFPAIALADTPLPPALQEKIGAVSSAVVFRLDAKQEIAFDQQHQPRATTGKLTDKDREAQWQQHLRDREAFLATQRKNPATLTSKQWRELAAILRDEDLHLQGLFSVAGRSSYAVEARSGGGTLTVVVGYNLLSVRTPGAEDNVLLNDQGAARLRSWEESVGVAGW